MKIQYTVRLDDACTTMDVEKWEKIEYILNANDIAPLVGIIPANMDEKLLINAEDKKFWEKVKLWENKNWELALHGYNHVCSTKSGGVNPVWDRSEFADVPLQQQKEKIKKGLEIFYAQGLNPRVFFAPSHTFDENTLRALKEESQIRIISDTMANKPYRHGDFVIIPQQFGNFKLIPIPGIWTFCFHPNTMTDNDFNYFEYFLRKHRKRFISYKDIDILKVTNKNVFSRLISFVYFSWYRSFVQK